MIIYQLLSTYLLLAEALLDNDDGCSQDAYERLLDWIRDNFDREAMKDLSSRVEAVDGRYYLPKDTDLMQIITNAGRRMVERFSKGE